MTLKPLIFVFAVSAMAIAEEKVAEQPSVPQQPVPGELPIPLQQHQIRLPVPLQAPPTGQAWLGLQLSKADPTTSAHIPALPVGVGFIIKSIDAGGPGEAAKLMPMDVLWKMNDQMLINEAQLATLLRLSKPDEEVTLSIFRGGQLLSLKMKLGDLPLGRNGFTSELAENAILPGEIGPMRVVNVAERTASYSNDEGKAVLRRDGEVYFVTIRSKDDEVIFEGDVTGKPGFVEVPKAWQRRVWALKRGLDHALEGSMVPVRPPRPRVVTPPPP